MISQHHHISMFSHNLKDTDYFYTHILGMRRVKISVNQNLPTMYHVFYGDRLGSSGNDLTFFDYSKAEAKRPGTNAHTSVGLLVANKDALDYWSQRLDAYNVLNEKEDYFGEETLKVIDPSGVILRLFINADGYLYQDWEPWDQNDINPAFLIQGMGPVEITVRDKEALIQTLTSLFDYKVVTNTDIFARLRPKMDSIFGEINIIEKAGRIEKAGYGTIHHLAIYLEADSLAKIEIDLKAAGFKPSVYDRYYFSSLYFRDHNGVMFEVVAKNEAGFLTDTEEALLGKQLDLPPFLEGKRQEIEDALAPIQSWVSDDVTASD
ncbi:VOC family protein [Fundicoccus culcitae]|uniref:VOC family protein n=1 Tax=Fundicoccus culcitae TaxID=2969821 RepID=A0ABY5P699_9LACT|nr:VOC family protein [Fundicoccus culcitae]UUX34135.1 VOC family protein [Fundicoccus culcitae]